MTRMSRSVAQRYAAKKRRRKDAPRVLPRPGRAAPADTEASTDAAPAAQPRPEALPTPAGARSQPVRGAAARRTADYAQQYGYVWGDLRRVALLSGGLIAVLIGLSFVLK